MTKYNRILLKLSGESLMGNQQFGIDTDRLNDYAEQISDAVRLKVEVAIVIGGGNIFRGISGLARGFDRVRGDQMGMLATVINSLALQSALLQHKTKARVFTATAMEPIGELYTKDKVTEALQAGYVCLIAGGTGNPFFTTDTASALRGIELDADAMFKGTRVDGIYSADPEKDPNAIKFDAITFDEVYQRGLKIMDLTAATMCRENNLKVVVFNMDKKGNLLKVLNNEKIGTVVSNHKPDVHE